MYNNTGHKSIVFDSFVPENITNPKHVAVLMGGLSAEREVSLTSAKGIIKHLKELNYMVTPIDMGRDIAAVLINLKPDVVFNALHGGYGEDGCVSGMLEILGIPYTHSGVMASSIGMDKVKSRAIFIEHGIKCAEAKIVSKYDNLKEDPMPRPYVIKPISEGSSIGVNVVFENDNFDISNYEFNYGDYALVEKYIPGREIQVAIVGERALGAIEIIPKGRFYDYNAKYVEGMAVHLMPAPLDEQALQKVLDLSLKAHKALGCKTLSRVEFRYDDTKPGHEEFYILEVNTHPGMTPLSIVPEIAAYYGISYSDIINILIKDALLGHEKINQKSA